MRIEEAKDDSPWVRHAIEAATLIIAIAIGLTIGFGIFSSAIVVSGSMEPTLSVDDKVLLDHRNSLHGHWRRGDIVLFEAQGKWMEEDSDDLIKRIIGLPGETVAVTPEGVTINGKKLNEPYIKTDAQREADPDDTKSWTLGAGEYFVMGDNRSNSEDSRLKGPVADSAIHGRVALRIGPLSAFGKIAKPVYDF